MEEAWLSWSRCSNVRLLLVCFCVLTIRHQVVDSWGTSQGSDSEQTNGSVTRVWEETSLCEMKKLVLIRIQGLSGNICILQDGSLLFTPEGQLCWWNPSQRDISIWEISSGSGTPLQSCSASCHWQCFLVLAEALRGVGLSDKTFFKLHCKARWRTIFGIPTGGT